jgi:3-oxoacyl-[acyl-carrier-protein] synthase-3
MWLALDRLRRSGRLRPGHRVLVLGAEASKFMFGGFLYIHAEEPDRS